MPAELKKEQVLADDVEPIDLRAIDETAVYRAVIQLGSGISWRNFRGGRWKATERSDGKTEMVHHPGLHETGPIKGSTLAGLVSSHNRWHEHNRMRIQEQGTDSTNSSRRQKPLLRPVQSDTGPVSKGCIHRQLLVVDYRKTNEVATDVGRNLTQTDVIRQIVKETVTAIVPALAEAVAKAVKSSK